MAFNTTATLIVWLFNCFKEVEREIRRPHMPSLMLNLPALVITSLVTSKPQTVCLHLPTICRQTTIFTPSSPSVVVRRALPSSIPRSFRGLHSLKREVSRCIKMVSGFFNIFFPSRSATETTAGVFVLLLFRTRLCVSLYIYYVCLSPFIKLPLYLFTFASLCILVYLCIYLPLFIHLYIYIYGSIYLFVCVYFSPRHLSSQQASIPQ